MKPTWRSLLVIAYGVGYMIYIIYYVHLMIYYLLGYTVAYNDDLSCLQLPFKVINWYLVGVIETKSLCTYQPIYWLRHTAQIHDNDIMTIFLVHIMLWLSLSRDKLQISVTSVDFVFYCFLLDHLGGVATPSAGACVKRSHCETV